MQLKLAELINVLFFTWVSGMYWGPWLALTRSMAALDVPVFLAVTDRLARNMALLMTVLLPAALVSALPVLALSFGGQPVVFCLTLIALALFAVTLIVTMTIEVPIVAQIVQWTPSTLPANWQNLRDRWIVAHLARIAPSIVGLILALCALMF